MIIGTGAYRDGTRIDHDPDQSGHQDFGELAEACGIDSDFVWVGLFNPEPHELNPAARAFGIHPLAVEDALVTHERPKAAVFRDTLTPYRTRHSLSQRPTCAEQIRFVILTNHIRAHRSEFLETAKH